MAHQHQKYLLKLSDQNLLGEKSEVDGSRIVGLPFGCSHPIQVLILDCLD